jgi:metal-sulfur cluster biosynthetic enzyme
MTLSDAGDQAISAPGVPDPTAADAEMRAKILTALQSVQDPEIGFSVIDLELIRDVVFAGGEAEVRMIFTTPFCPYGPMLVSQVQLVSEEASGMPVTVTVLPDKWEPPTWLR